MKAKLFSILSCIVILSFFVVPGYTAQDPQLPASNAAIATGSTSEYLSQQQAAKESLILTQQSIEAAAQTGFVVKNDTALSLNGSTYKFSFANDYYLFYKSQYMIDNVFADAKSLGLNALRTWAFCDGMYKEGVSFQPSAGVYDESGFKKMDYILYKASQNDMKVILPFVNNWDDFGGIDQYVTWLTGSSPTNSHHDLFFTDPTIKNWYKDYVNYFLNRVNTYTGIAYKDDPTILALELANEPRAYTDSNGTVLNPWINEMAQYVKGVDSNHLLSAGIEGWYGYKDTYGSNTGVDFITSQSSPYIDLATFHLFPDAYNLSDTQVTQWIQDRASAAQTVLKKPVYIGEFGISVNRTAPDTSTQMNRRNSMYKKIYSTAASSKLSGLGFWMLASLQDNGTWYPDYDNYTVYTKDAATCKVIRAGTSSFLRNKR